VTKLLCKRLALNFVHNFNSNAPQLLTDATEFQAAWPAAGTE
jgi:hypothetical protein